MVANLPQSLKERGRLCARTTDPSALTKLSLTFGPNLRTQYPSGSNDRAAHSHPAGVRQPGPTCFPRCPCRSKATANDGTPNCGQAAQAPDASIHSNTPHSQHRHPPTPDPRNSRYKESSPSDLTELTWVLGRGRHFCFQ